MALSSSGKKDGIVVNLSDVDSLLRLVDREVWIVAAEHGGSKAGLTATWVSQVSLDAEKPMLLAGLAPNHATTEVVKRAGFCSLHLLAKSQTDLAFRFASGSSRELNKFEGIAEAAGPAGTPKIPGCVAWFECKVVASYDAGDREFFWGEVLDGDGDLQGIPLRQSEFFAALSESQKQVLRLDRAKDIEIQRPGREAWLKSQRNENGV